MICIGSPLQKICQNKTMLILIKNNIEQNLSLKTYQISEQLKLSETKKLIEIMIKGSILKKVILFLIMRHLTRGYKDMWGKVIELKKEMDKSTIILEDFSLLPIIDRGKISKDFDDIKTNLIILSNIVDIYRILYP